MLLISPGYVEFVEKVENGSDKKFPILGCHWRRRRDYRIFRTLRLTFPRDGGIRFARGIGSGGKLALLPPYSPQKIFTRKDQRQKVIHKKCAKTGNFWRKFRLFSTTDGVEVVDEGNIHNGFVFAIGNADEIYLVPTYAHVLQMAQFVQAMDAKTPDLILDQMFLCVN